MDVLAYCLMPTHYHLLVRVKPLQQPQTSEFLKNSEVLVLQAVEKIADWLEATVGLWMRK